MTKILVSDLKPNPFRDMGNYPINDDKVDALVHSIKSTEFWDNLLVRKAPDGDGYEMAYGHHRRVALKKAKVEEIDVPVRKLDDTTMARIMAQENMEEWGSSAAIEQETVRSIIAGYGEGRIDLPEPKSKAGHIRFAPSFVMGDDLNSSKDHPYTIETLGEFLGWKHYKVEAAVSSLALIEKSIATPETFKGLSSRQAKAVTEQTARVMKETKNAKTAGSVARGLAAGFRKSMGKATASDKKSAKEVTIHSARSIADDLSGKGLQPKAKKLPNFEKFIDSIAKATGWYFENKKAQWQAVVQFRAEMPAEQRKRLIASLRSLIKQSETMIKKLEA